MKKITALLFTLAFMLIGCSMDHIENIPAGYVGKKLTPTGWETGILEAGQVNLGNVNTDNTYTSLVTLEASSISVKESFAVNGNDDHRILIGKSPVTVDVYVRIMIPREPAKRNAIFAMITPEHKTERVSNINVEAIYNKLAKMDIRSGIRSVMQKYTDVSYIATHMDTINNELGAMAIKMFERSGVPLEIQNVTLSNVKMDQTVNDAENQKNAALAQVEAINAIGNAIKSNPGYLQFKKYETLERLNGKNANITFIDGNPTGMVLGK